MPQTTAVLGLSWGDEAKGRLVDNLAKDHEIIVRFSGSLNAGHTLVVDGKKHILRLVPSGMLHSHTIGVITHGVMIELDTLLSEIKELNLPTSRLFVSDSCFLVLPIHKYIDEARETIHNHEQKFTIGTTKNGIGPSFEDKVRRYGIRISDLKNEWTLHVRLTNIILPYWAKEYKFTEPLEQISKRLAEKLHKQYLEIKPYLTNTTLFLNSMIDCGSSVLFEGAQGTMLDLDFGTYPFVTSSNCTVGAISTGAGVPGKKINTTYGVIKAYTTRVGSGPFPTEINPDSNVAKFIQQKGNEFGSVTKRPRRVGWLDIPLINYACIINGVDKIFMAKYDVLYDLDEIKIATNYGTNENNIATPLENNSRINYQTLNPKTKFTSRLNLQESCERYIKNINVNLKAPIDSYSLGPERESFYKIGI